MGKNFCGFLGNGCVGLGMAMESLVSQGSYVSMVLEKLQISQEDGIEATRVFISKNAE